MIPDVLFIIAQFPPPRNGYVAECPARLSKRQKAGERLPFLGEICRFDEKASQILCKF